MNTIVSFRSWRTPVVCALAGLAFGLAVPLPAAPKKKAAPAPTTAAAYSATYSGQATAAALTFGTGTAEVMLLDVGPLPPTGGSLTQSVGSVSLGGGALTVSSAEASTSGAANVAHSTVVLTNVRILITTVEDGLLTFTADSIRADADAKVAADGSASAGGGVTFTNFRLNGVPINVTGEPNQEFWVAGGRIIINEQISLSAEGSADIVVNALRFWLSGCNTGVVASVCAGVTAVPGEEPPPSQEECGKLTGGGWIIDTPSGDKGTFGVSGGIRRGEFWGHLNYVDHGTGMHVQSTAVTGYAHDPASANGRIVTYNVTIDGTPGTATVRVVDNGEPGREDIFEISLSNGYRAGRELGGSRPGGGNIQLHKCPKGWH